MSTGIVRREYLESGGSSFGFDSKDVQVKKIKYLESTGTQYIDTGLKPTANTRVKIDFQVTKTPTNNSEAIIGGWGNPDTNGILFGIYNKTSFRFAHGSVWNGTTMPLDFDKHRAVINDASGNCTVDGTILVTKSDITTSMANNNNIYLFNCALGATFSSSRIYYCAIYEGDSLLREFIPALDESNIPCMFDTVTQTYYYNKGTGSFIPGIMLRCGYLESTGTQYIDTGIIPDSTTKFEILAEVTTPTVQTDTCLFGSRTNNGSDQYIMWDGHNSANVEHRIGFITGTWDETRIMTISRTRNLFKYDGSAFYINGEKKLDITNSMTAGKYPIFLFGLNQDGSIESRRYKGKVFYFKIWKGSQLVRDLIPVIDGDGIPCMYDNISQSFFYNKGTGDFTAGVEEIEYIESTGKQWIDTGYKPNDNTKFEMLVGDVAKRGSNTIFMASTTFEGKTFNLLNNASKFYWHYGATKTFGDDNIFNTKSKITLYRGSITFNDSVVLDDTSIDTPKAISNACIFGSGLFPNYLGAFKLYYFKIYDNNILVRSFVPAIDPYGVVCLYDEVTKQYFYNQGDGEFIGGYEDPIHELEYLESTGTQYVNTGIIPDSTTRWELDIAITELVATGDSINGLGPTNNIDCRFGIGYSAYTGFVGGFYFGIGKNGYKVGTADTNRHKFFIDLKNEEYGMDDYSETFSTTYVAGTYPMYLFARNYNGVSGYLKQKLYGCKIYKNDVLVCDLVPVLDKNNVACLYDKITRRYFYNKGTGVFKTSPRNSIYESEILDYIETNGAQYIDTGIVPNQDTSIEMAVSFNNMTDIECLWCARNSTSPYNSFTSFKYQNVWRSDYYNTFNQFSSNVLETGKTYIFKQDMNISYMNGTLLKTVTKTDFTAPDSLWLFASWENAHGSVTGHYGKYKMYYCKIWQGGELFRDFVPMIDSYGVVCLYDKITKTYFYNKGKGDFIAGTVTKCNYIESTGTQYINTGVVPTSKTRIEFKIDSSSKQITEYPQLFGSQVTSDGVNRFGIRYNWVARTGSTDMAATNAKYDYPCIGSLELNKFKLNDKVYTSTNTFTAPTVPIYLFAVNIQTDSEPSTIPRTYSVAKIYYFRIWEDSVLVRDFIPSIDPSGVVCLYDMVTHEYFYNQDTGNFIAGRIQHKEIDYLESIGMQYIDTEIVPTSKTRMELKFKLNKTDTTQNMGWTGNSPTEAFAIEMNATNSAALGFNSYVTSNFTRRTSGVLLDKDIHTYDLQSGSQKFDGVEYATDIMGDTAVSGQTMYLFGVHAEWITTGAHLMNYANIYTCKIYEDNVLVRDFIPVINSEGKACLYDKVSKSYFYNQNQGQFLVNNCYENVVYNNNHIKSSGTQYIDTEVLVDQNTKVELKFRFNSISGTQLLLGASETYWDSKNLQISAYQSSETVYRFGDKNIVVTDKDILENYIGVINTVTIDKYGVKYEGGGITRYYQFDYTGSFESDKSIQIFARNANYFASAQVFSCKVWKNNKLLLDFEPSYNELKQGCLYEEISETYFNNKGTGTFTGNFGEISGQQYIDTGIIPNQDITVEVKVTPTYESEGYWIFGSRRSQTENIDNYGLFIKNVNNGEIWYQYKNYDASNITNKNINDKSTILRAEKNVLYVNGEPVITKDTQTFEGINPLYLFTMNTNGVYDNRVFKGKIHYCKIWQDDILVRDFIPITYNDVPCLYDAANNKYYYNQGNGQFLYGAEVATKTEFNMTTLDKEIAIQPYRELFTRINVLDLNMDVIDELSGYVTNGSFTIDANADIRRTCRLELVVNDSTFNIEAGSDIWLDRYIQPYIGIRHIATQEIVWYNLGVYLINKPSLSYSANERKMEFEGVDLMSKLTGLRNGTLQAMTTKIEAGAEMENVLKSTISQLGGFKKYVIECEKEIPYDITIDVGGTVYELLSKIRDIYPNYEMFFDVNGTFIFQKIPSEVSDPIMIDDNLWKHIVISENVDINFEDVKNKITVLGKSLDPDEYGGDAVIDSNAYKITLEGKTKVEENETIGFVANSILATPKLTINNGTSNIETGIAIVNEDGKAATIPEAGEYYVVKKRSDGKYLYMGRQQPKWTSSDTNPDSPFSTNKIGEIYKVLYGGEFDNITTDDLCRQRADYELWKHTRLNDSLNLTCVPLYLLDTNIKIAYTDNNSGVSGQYIIKSVNTDLGIGGTQTVEAIKFYPLYPDI